MTYELFEAGREITGPYSFSGRLFRVRDPFSTPPGTIYEFITTRGIVSLELTTLGFLPDDLPLQLGANYSISVERVVDQNITTYGIAVSDSAGVLAILESDWGDALGNPIPEVANSDRFNYIFNKGYPIELETIFANPDCEQLLDTPGSFLGIWNWQLQLVTDTESLSLWQTQTGTIGEWTIHAFRVQRRLPGLPEDIAPQISWMMVRSSLLPEAP